MNGSSRSYPRQMGYYYPQHMQGYYQQAAPGYLEQQLPQQHYGQQDYYQPYAPIQPMPMQPPVFSNPYPIPRPNQQQPSQFQSIMSQFKKSQWAI